LVELACPLFIRFFSLELSTLRKNKISYDRSGQFNLKFSFEFFIFSSFSEAESELHRQHIDRDHFSLGRMISRFRGRIYQHAQPTDLIAPVIKREVRIEMRIMATNGNGSKKTKISKYFIQTYDQILLNIIKINPTKRIYVQRTIKFRQSHSTSHRRSRCTIAMHADASFIANDKVKQSFIADQRIAFKRWIERKFRQTTREEGK